MKQKQTIPMITSFLSEKTRLEIQSGLYGHITPEQIYTYRIEDTDKGGAYVLPEIEKLCQPDYPGRQDIPHLKHILMSVLAWLYDDSWNTSADLPIVSLRKKRLNALLTSYCPPDTVRTINRFINQTYAALRKARKTLYREQVRQEAGLNHLYPSFTGPLSREDMANTVFIESGITDAPYITDSKKRHEILVDIIRRTSSRKREPTEHVSPAPRAGVHKALKKLHKLLAKHQTLTDVKKAWDKKRTECKVKIVLRDLLKNVHGNKDINQWRTCVSQLLANWPKPGHPFLNGFSQDERRAKQIIALLGNVKKGELPKAFRYHKYGKSKGLKSEVPESTARNQAAAITKIIHAWLNKAKAHNPPV